MTGLCYVCDSVLNAGDISNVGLDGEHFVFRVHHHRNGPTSMQTCPTYLIDEHGAVLPQEVTS